MTGEIPTTAEMMQAAAHEFNQQPNRENLEGFWRSFLQGHFKVSNLPQGLSNERIVELRESGVDFLYIPRTLEVRHVLMQLKKICGIWPKMEDQKIWRSAQDITNEDFYGWMGYHSSIIAPYLGTSSGELYSSFEKIRAQNMNIVQYEFATNVSRVLTGHYLDSFDGDNVSFTRLLGTRINGNPLVVGTFSPGYIRITDGLPGGVVSARIGGRGVFKL